MSNMIENYEKNAVTKFMDLKKKFLIEIDKLE